MRKIFRSETLHSDPAYLQEKAENILQIFTPLSSHTELLEMNTHILMAEDELATACEEGDEDGKRKAVAAYQKYWKKLNIPLLHASLNIHKLEHEPRFNHAMDAYGLFLVIHAIREWEEMSWREHADDRTCLFSDFFLESFRWSISKG